MQRAGVRPAHWPAHRIAGPSDGSGRAWSPRGRRSARERRGGALAALARRLRGAQQPCDRGIPLALPRPAAVPGGRGRGREDGDRERARRRPRPAADPAPVLRRARPLLRGVRVELSPADDRDPARRGRGRTLARSAGGRHLLDSVPHQAPAAASVGIVSGGSAGAAHRRDRPRRRAVRSVPARGAVRLPDHDPGDRAD